MASPQNLAGDPVDYCAVVETCWVGRAKLRWELAVREVANVYFVHNIT